MKRMPGRVMEFPCPRQRQADPGHRAPPHAPQERMEGSVGESEADSASSERSKLGSLEFAAAALLAATTAITAGEKGVFDMISE